MTIVSCKRGVFQSPQLRAHRLFTTTQRSRAARVVRTADRINRGLPATPVLFYAEPRELSQTTWAILSAVIIVVMILGSLHHVL